MKNQYKDKNEAFMWTGSAIFNPTTIQWYSKNAILT